MPVYQYQCVTCEKGQDAFRTVNERHSTPLCSCGSQTKKVISAPSMVMNDISPYKAVAGDQRWITSRAQHREFLKSNGLEEVGNG
jgi:putative FmdB family regulatory protein